MIWNIHLKLRKWLKLLWRRIGSSKRHRVLLIFVCRLFRSLLNIHYIWIESRFFLQEHDMENSITAIRVIWKDINCDLVIKMVLKPFTSSWSTCLNLTLWMYVTNSVEEMLFEEHDKDSQLKCIIKITIRTNRIWDVNYQLKWTRMNLTAGEPNAFNCGQII